MLLVIVLTPQPFYHWLRLPHSRPASWPIASVKLWTPQSGSLTCPPEIDPESMLGFWSKRGMRNAQEETHS